MNYAELTNHITNLMSQNDIELKEQQHTDTSETTKVFALITDSETETVKTNSILLNSQKIILVFVFTILMKMNPSTQLRKYITYMMKTRINTMN